MIGQCLSNKNESATVEKSKNFSQESSGANKWKSGAGLGRAQYKLAPMQPCIAGDLL